MPKAKPYSRIAITLPERDLAAADRLASLQDRSRSWIIAEAIRTYAAACEADAAQDRANAEIFENGARRVIDGDLPPRSRPGLGTSRLAQLTRDLTLTPEARVRAAEETLRLTEPRDQPRKHRILAFDRYEDFLDWQSSRHLG